MEQESTIMCLKCMAPNAGTAHVCIECGAPLSLANMLDPMTALYADAAAVSNAVYRPTRPIVVFTIWIIFLPGLIGSLFGMSAGVATPGTAGLIFFWLFAGLAILSAIALFRVTKNYFKPRFQDQRASHLPSKS